MKHLITSIACMVLLLALLMQFVQNQVLYQNLVMVNSVVDETTSDQSALKAEISQIMGCDADAVMVREDGDFVEVKFPITHVLASPSFWGVESEENVIQHTIRRPRQSTEIGEVKGMNP